jgi:hypothetical protein
MYIQWPISYDCLGSMLWSQIWAIFADFLWKNAVFLINLIYMSNFLNVALFWVKILIFSPIVSAKIFQKIIASVPVHNQRKFCRNHLIMFPFKRERSQYLKALLDFNENRQKLLSQSKHGSVIAVLFVLIAIPWSRPTLLQSWSKLLCPCKTELDYFCARSFLQFFVVPKSRQSTYLWI